MSLEKWMIFTTLQKLPKNVGDLGKSKALESCPKSNKSPNLVTLSPYHNSVTELFQPAYFDSYRSHFSTMELTVTYVLCAT